MTLLDLRNAAKDLCDYQNNPAVSDTTWTKWINDGIERLWRIIAKRDVGVFQTSQAFALSGGIVNAVAKPATMRRLMGVSKDPTIPSMRRSLPKYNFGERDSLGLLGPVAYHVIGQTIAIEPASISAGNYALYFVAGPTILVADADLIDTVLEPYDDYPTTWAAIKALGKEESATTDLRNDLTELAQSIDEFFAFSDGDDPSTIVDDDARGPVLYTVP